MPDVTDHTRVIHCREAEFADVYRRIRDGDPILGWRGDEHAELWRREKRDPNGLNGWVTQWFVMLRDANGEPYPAVYLEAGEQLDGGMRLAAKLRDGDWQHGRGKALVAQQQAEQVRAEQAREQAHKDRAREVLVPSIWNIARTGRA